MSWLQLDLFKEVGYSSEATPSLVRLHNHVWKSDAAWKRTSTTRARRKPRVPLGLESHFGPVRHKWSYRMALNIIETLKLYHDDNVWSGDTVSRVGVCMDIIFIFSLVAHPGFARVPFFYVSWLLNLRWTFTNPMTYFLFKSFEPFSCFSETNEQHLIFIYKICTDNVFIPLVQFGK